LAISGSVAPHPLWQRAYAWLPSLVPQPPALQPEVYLYNLTTGATIDHVPGNEFAMSPDGNFLATWRGAASSGREFGEVAIWDIPPSKPLGWFTLACASVATLYALSVWRHERRRRRHFLTASAPSGG